MKISYNFKIICKIEFILNVVCCYVVSEWCICVSWVISICRVVVVNMINKISFEVSDVVEMVFIYSVLYK